MLLSMNKGNRQKFFLSGRSAATNGGAMRMRQKDAGFD
jgi:hypothetical protein